MIFQVDIRRTDMIQMESSNRRKYIFTVCSCSYYMSIYLILIHIKIYSLISFLCCIDIEFCYLKDIMKTLVRK